MRPSGGRNPIHQPFRGQMSAGAVQPLRIAGKAAVQRFVEDLRAGIVLKDDWCAGFDIQLPICEIELIHPAIC